MSFTCLVCKTDKNVYHAPKWCNPITWFPEAAKLPHCFCLYCFLKFSHESYCPEMNSARKFTCPAKYCGAGSIFEIQHCESGLVRNINNLLRELECFSLCHYEASVKDVLTHIDGCLSYHVATFSKNGFNGRGLSRFNKLMAWRRRFVVRPSTYDECKKPAVAELDFYNWDNHPKCAKCDSEYNLHQCVNKSECEHICFLKCFFKA